MEFPGRDGRWKLSSFLVRVWVFGLGLGLGLGLRLRLGLGLGGVAEFEIGYLCPDLPLAL